MVDPKTPNQEDIVDATIVRAADEKPEYLWFEYAYHASMLIVAIGVLTLSFLMTLDGETAVFLPGASLPLPDSCMSRDLFGMDCPGCGLTRSFICFSRGDLEMAGHFNFAGPLAYIFAVLQIPWRVWQFWNLKKHSQAYYSPWLFAAPGIVLGTLLFQWLVKLL